MPSLLLDRVSLRQVPFSALQTRLGVLSRENPDFSLTGKAFLESVAGRLNLLTLPFFKSLNPQNLVLKVFGVGLLEIFGRHRRNSFEAENVSLLSRKMLVFGCSTIVS